MTITAADLPNNSFAEACYDQNSISDLRVALENGADAADMREWNLTADEWKSQIEMAIAALENDSE